MKLLRIFVNPYFYLLIILILGFGMRLYKINNPIADWHSWRQADTAAVARNFYKEGYVPLYPKLDDMSTTSELSRQPNLKRYRFVEFPIYGSLVYFAYLANGGVDEYLARLVNIFFALGSTLFIFFIARKYFNQTTALIASLIYAVLPFNVYFTRVILPEASLVFFSLGMFYFVDRWIRENKFYLFVLSLLFTICAFLTKPMAIFYLLPLFYSYLQVEKKLFPVPLRYFYLFIPALIPFAFWRVWIMQYPEGIPGSDWLFNGNGIRFRPAFWRWIVSERLGGEILTVVGFSMFVLGLLIKPVIKSNYLLHFFALSSFLFLIVFATGNVQHDYYQAFIMPALAIFTARGFALLLSGYQGFVARIWTMPLAVFFFFLMLFLNWYQIRDFYNINNPSIIKAGLRADAILPKDAIVIAPYMGDTAFLYQTNRPGFPFVVSSFEEMISRYGVGALVSVAKDKDTKEAMDKYTTLEETDEYVIVDLTKPKVK